MASTPATTMPMFASTITPRIMPVQKLIKYPQIIGSHLIVVFGIKLGSFRIFYLVLFSFQAILDNVLQPVS
jgi:hypothetical protein